MLKYILLATTMTIAAPAVAQDAKTGDKPAATQQTTPPASDQTATTDDSAAPAQAAPVSPDPAPATQTAQPTPEPSEGQPAQTAQQPVPAQPGTAPVQSAQQPTPAQPAQQPTETAQQPAQGAATSSTQIAQVVSTEFKSYDKDANGGLNQSEFSTWMAALRKASDPNFKDGPDAVKWSTQAFAQADTDKNKAISQAELTTFLTPKTAS